jgi:hypothetical protein
LMVNILIPNKRGSYCYHLKDVGAHVSMNARNPSSIDSYFVRGGVIRATYYSQT